MNSGAIKKALALCFVLAIMLETLTVVLTVSASAETSGDFQYSLINEDSEVEITGYTGPGGSVVIRDTIDGRPVTSIGESAFSNRVTITSMTIPEGVTSINRLAFFHCINMASVNLPNTLTTIGRASFDQCLSLDDLILPESLRTIDTYGFRDCHSLRNFTLPNGLSSIGEGAFINCTSLTTLTIPGTITTFGPYLFGGCTNLTHIKLSDNLVEISRRAFTYCNSLEEIEIPDSVTSIGEGAFVQCFELTKVTIPDGVTGVGNIAFKMCSSLTTVTIGKSVLTIGDYAFENCSALGTINFLGSAKPTVGTGWLDNCSSAITGHAYASSNFPGQGGDFYGLTMGNYIPAITAPGAPSDLSVKFNDGKIKLSWTAPSDDGGDDITGYKILKGIDSSYMGYLATVNGTTYEDGDVSVGVTYYYKVIAVNNEGGSNASDTVNFKIEEPAVNTVDRGQLYTVGAIATGAIIGMLLCFYHLWKHKDNPVDQRADRKYALGTFIVGILLSVIGSITDEIVRFVFLFIATVMIILTVYYAVQGFRNSPEPLAETSAPPDENTPGGKE